MFKCHLYNWEDICQLCKELVKKIKANGYKVDVIVAIARGGWVPARILADLLEVKELYSVKTEHWGMVATITGEAKITQPLNVKLEGKNVLIVDDVADTGETIKLVKEHVKSMLAKEIKIAVIDYKKTSKFIPDYYASEMEGWKWIVYPWSLKEDVKGLISGKAKSLDEAIRILEDHGLKLSYEEVREIIEE